jgi:hypothetical protein
MFGKQRNVVDDKNVLDVEIVINVYPVKSAKAV